MSSTAITVGEAERMSGRSDDSTERSVAVGSWGGSLVRNRA